MREDHVCINNNLNSPSYWRLKFFNKQDILIKMILISILSAFTISNRNWPNFNLFETKMRWLKDLAFA